ncbi:hypothetical protein P152DRAFT_173281 [Eremomyces bilateralis CBS 781.70]|uniref:Uncharacterized protein n=1 Tax=Eremomyces bilateralis CBS 781.70 TaxID=1392243 RepID=A0A6G1FT16_9PEZI|nr:uncharacterized protein P152DRAFT_173281 [Eremomyces bilateralis CBS 781.70]KAF1809015.1 hypothetical protein P152DRAFT_173281 [Eremomyces bilateralis CBS 781.70]
MPALRATRQSNRTSRTSSPYVHSPNEPSTQTTTKESNRVDPDVWDEPPLKDPAPSFEEHGFDRVGVLETMAPLGSLPSLKLKGKTKDSIRRSTLSRSALGNQSEDALDSAKTTPSIPPSRSQSHMPEGQPSRDVSEPRDEEEDEEYVPNGHGPVTRHSKPPTKLNISFAALNQNPPPVTPSRRRSKGRDRLLKESVTEAIKVAEQNGQILIAITLQTLLDNRTREVAVDDLIHDILHQRKMTASQVELMRRFFALSTKRMNSTRSRDRGYIKAITSIGAAENRQHTQFSPHPSHLPFHNNLPTNTPDSQPSHSIKSSPVHPSLDASSQPGSKRRSPRKVMTTNGTGKSTTNDQSQADQGRERARSVSSTSSLSSVDEAIVEEGSPSTVALKNLIGNSPRTSNRPNGPFRDLNRTMATFFGGQHNKKRSHDAMAGPMDAEAEQLLRKKFMRAFPDYHVDSSEIRSSVQRAKEAEERAPAPVEPSRTTRQSLAGPLLPPRTAHALQYPFAGRSREASPREGNKLKTAAARVKTS